VWDSGGGGGTDLPGHRDPPPRLIDPDEEQPEGEGPFAQEAGQKQDGRDKPGREEIGGAIGELAGAGEAVEETQKAGEEPRSKHYDAIDQQGEAEKGEADIEADIVPPQGEAG
jgi:hypothetical protein